MKKTRIRALALALLAALVLTFGGLAQSVSNELEVPFQGGTDGPSFQPKGQVETTIGMAADPAQSARGETVQFTITLTNSGDGAATGLAVDAVSPLDVVERSNNGLVDGLNIGWTNLTVPENSFITLWFTVHIPEDAHHGQSYEASASLGGDKSANASTQVEAPGTQLELIKTSNRWGAMPGQAIVYTLTLDNTNGAENYSDLTVIDALPEGMAFSGDAPAGAVISEKQRTWTVGNLEAGQGRACPMPPPSCRADGQEFVNEAALTEPALSDSRTVTALLPVTTLTKGVDDDTPEPGQWEFRFAVTVRNAQRRRDRCYGNRRTAGRHEAQPSKAFQRRAV